MKGGLGVETKCLGDGGGGVVLGGGGGGDIHPAELYADESLRIMLRY